MTIPKNEEDLTWYYNASDAACGLRSNFGCMQFSSTSTNWADPYIPIVMSGSLEKRRRIERCLSQLTSLQQRTLQVIFGENRIPLLITHVMGPDLAGPALLTSVDLSAEDFLHLCSRLSLGTAEEEDHATINRIRREARDLRHDALNAYRRERQKQAREDIAKRIIQ